MPKQGASELRDLDVERVDGVDKPATGRNFLLFKSADGDAIMKGYAMVATAADQVLKAIRKDADAVLSRKSAIALNGLAQVLGQGAVFVGKSVPTQPYMFVEPGDLSSQTAQRGPADEYLGPNFSPRSMPGDMVGKVEFRMKEDEEDERKRGPKMYDDEDRKRKRGYDEDEEDRKRKAMRDEEDRKEDRKRKMKEDEEEERKALRTARKRLVKAKDEEEDEDERKRLSRAIKAIDERLSDGRDDGKDYTAPVRSHDSDYAGGGGTWQQSRKRDKDNDEDMDGAERANRNVARGIAALAEAVSANTQTLKALMAGPEGVQKIQKDEDGTEPVRPAPRSRQVAGDDVPVRKTAGRFGVSMADIVFQK